MRYVNIDSVISYIADCKTSRYLPTNCDAIRLIENIDPKDAIEIIRCCECMYHEDSTPYHYCYKWHQNCPDDSDFYCKFAERTIL